MDFESKVAICILIGSLFLLAACFVFLMDGEL
jgi:hypothetical protein